MNDKELSLVEQMYGKRGELAFSEILEMSAFSREPTFRHLQNLVKQGIIRKRQIGNLFLYSINYDNPQTSSILSVSIYRKLKTLQADEIIEKMTKTFITLPVLFALISHPKKKGRSKYFNVIVIYTGDKSLILSEVQRLEKQFQYTNKINVSFSLYSVNEFENMIRENQINDFIPFFNSERMFISLKYMNDNS